jgi:hypothetical protein
MLLHVTVEPYSPPYMDVFGPTMGGAPPYVNLGKCVNSFDGHSFDGRHVSHVGTPP